MGVEASIIVEFGDGSDASTSGVVVELDDLHPNNITTNPDGSTSIKNFGPGDEPVLLVHLPDDIRITRVGCTDGTVTKIGRNEVRNRKVNALFTGVEDKVTPSYSEFSITGVTWYGHSANLYVKDSSIVPHFGTFPCLGDITIRVVFNEQWKLIPPRLSLGSNETYTIYVVIYVERI